MMMIMMIKLKMKEKKMIEGIGLLREAQHSAGATSAIPARFLGPPPCSRKDLVSTKPDFVGTFYAT